MTLRRFTRRCHPALASLWSNIGVCLLSGALVGCVSLEDPWASQLAEIGSETAVTLTGRSILNPTDIRHEHILRVNGILAGKFKNDEIKTFQIPAGPQLLTLTCHTSSISGSQDQPFNYNRASGKTKLEIDPKPGDELCLKISYAITNCAVLKEADPSYCLRKQPE